MTTNKRDLQSPPATSIEEDVINQFSRGPIGDRLYLLASIVENSDDAIITKTPQGIITTWNSAAEKIYGYAALEVIGQPISILIPPGHTNEVPAILERIRRGEGIHHYETLRQRKDGQVIHVSISIAPVKDKEGQVVGASTIARDITTEVVTRKEAEDKLAAAAQYARSLIESSLDPLVTISAGGKITDVNEATIQVTGVSREQLISTDFSDYFTEPEKAREGYRLVFAQGFVTDYPLTIRRKDGRLTDALYNASVYKDTHGNVIGVFAAARDITERKRAEDAFRASEVRYRTVADFTYDWEYWLGPDGHYIYVSPACERITGYRPAEFQNDPALLETITHPAERALLAQDLHGLDASRAPHSMDFRILARNGETRWIGHWCQSVYSAEGKYLGRRGSNRDITERKQAEEALRASEQQLRLLATNLPAALSYVNARDLRYRFVNRAFTVMFGLTPEQVQGKPIREVLGEAAYARALPYIDRVRAGERLENEALITIHGEPHWVGITYIPEFDTPGTVQNFIVLAVDITERKLAEERLTHALERLDLATRAGGLGIWDWDIRRNEHVWNDRMYELFGIKPGDFDGTYEAWLARVHPDDRAASDEISRQAQRGERGYDTEYRVVWPDGTVRVLKAYGQFVRGAAGQPLRMTGVNYDITERKQAEEKVRRQNIELSRSNALILALNKVSREMQQINLHPDRVMQILCNELKRIRVGCFLSLRDSGDQSFTMRYSTLEPDAQVRFRALTGQGMRLSRQHMALFPQLIEQKQAHFISDPLVMAAKLFPDIPITTLEQSLASFGFSTTTSAMALPLVAEDQMQALLAIWGDDLQKEDLPIFSVFASQVAICLENARLFEQVHNSRRRLQTLSRQLIEAQEKERHRIARELHDEIGQILTGLALLLEVQPHGLSTEQRVSLVEAQSLVNDLMNRLREISLDLRPAMLDDLGLLSALLWHFDRFTAQTGVAVRFKQHGLAEARFPSGLELAAYRIVQEALTNVARHARVKSAEVRVWTDPEGLHVEIKDRGVGFEPQAGPKAEAAQGLAGMHERALLCGGRLTVDSAPGKGTCVYAILPLHQRLERRRDDRLDRAGG